MTCRGCHVAPRTSGHSMMWPGTCLRCAPGSRAWPANHHKLLPIPLHCTLVGRSGSSHLQSRCRSHASLGQKIAPRRAPRTHPTPRRTSCRLLRLHRTSIGNLAKQYPCHKSRGTSHNHCATNLLRGLVLSAQNSRPPTEKKDGSQYGFKENV